MVCEATEEAVSAAEWKLALDLLQMGATYHNEAGDRLLTHLAVGLEGKLDLRFWFQAYFAQCSHEWQKAVDTMDVRSSVDMRMIEENTYLSQALAVLGLMEDMAVDADQRFQLVQHIVAKRLVAKDQANAWFVDTIGTRVLSTTADTGDILTDVEDSWSPECLMLHCSSKPAAAAASAAASTSSSPNGPWLQTAAAELTSRIGDTIYHTWVYNSQKEVRPYFLLRTQI
eukprot:SAG31_NODE_17064_length_684_cov_2.032479_1_plen_227_part_11